MKLAFAIIVTVALIGGWLFVSSRDNDDQVAERSVADNQPTEKTPSDSNDKLVYGDPDAPATIIEYIDYKCPNCNEFHRTTHQEIIQTYGDKVQYEFRVYPYIGPDSGRASRGAYCAAEQGSFPEYHDAVMSHMHDRYYDSGNFAAEFEDVLTTDVLTELATTFISDTDAFRTCLDSEEKNVLIDRDLNSAADDEINGTPGFVINGQKFIGKQPFSVFKTLLDISLR